LLLSKRDSNSYRRVAEMEWLVDVCLKVLGFAILLTAVDWVVLDLSDSWLFTGVVGAVFTLLWWRGGK
jgi:hypothetical protein